MSRLGADADDSRSDPSVPQARFVLAVGAAIAFVYALWLLVAAQGGDFPLNDDWSYAWSARHLLETGEL